jgi:hypothetical protein
VRDRRADLDHIGIDLDRVELRNFPDCDVTRFERLVPDWSAHDPRAAGEGRGFRTAFVERIERRRQRWRDIDGSRGGRNHGVGAPGSIGQPVLHFATERRSNTSRN